MSVTTKSIRTVAGRMQTFDGAWPHKHHVNLIARDLAEAGFFFTPTTKSTDRVTCAYCGLELAGWNADRENMAREAHVHGNPGQGANKRLQPRRRRKLHPSTSRSLCTPSLAEGIALVHAHMHTHSLPFPERPNQ
jgi:hypothetical protein